ncbi:hypothetical protein ES703_112296 [subsurface metagenome]
MAAGRWAAPGPAHPVNRAATRKSHTGNLCVGRDFCTAECRLWDGGGERKRCELGAGCWVLDIGCWILDVGYLMLDIGYSMLDAICLLSLPLLLLLLLLLDAGYSMLTAYCHCPSTPFNGSTSLAGHTNKRHVSIT